MGESILTTDEDTSRLGELAQSTGHPYSFSYLVNGAKHGQGGLL